MLFCFGQDVNISLTKKDTEKKLHKNLCGKNLEDSKISVYLNRLGF